MMRALLLSSATIDTPAVRSSVMTAARGGRPGSGGAAVGWPTSGTGAGVVIGAAGKPAPPGAAVTDGIPGAPGRNAGWPETASGSGPDDTVGVVVREREATRPCSWLP